MDPRYFFCPSPECPNHRLDLSDEKWFVRYGYHDTRAFGRVPRYRCRHCGKTFSDQTFLLNYWLKKKTDFDELGKAINSSSSANFVGRHHHFSADSMRIRHDRLARNALFLQAMFTAARSIEEPLVADGLESYVLNQFFPINLNILVGKHSQFVYYFTESHSRRKGRMTPEQQERSKHIYLDKSFEESKISVMFEKLLEYLEGRCPRQTITLHTDIYPMYEKAITRWNEAVETGGGGPEIIHLQTSSKEERTTRNPLFAVNYLDRLIRKDMPNHRRETICQARNDRNLLSRFAYYVVTHNFFKPFRIYSGAKQMKTLHADRVMERDERFDRWKDQLHEKRFFRSFVELPEYFEAVWFRRTPTPLKDGADPVPQFAYQ